jgi:hypothetical protein
MQGGNSAPFALCLDDHICLPFNARYVQSREPGQWKPVAGVWNPQSRFLIWNSPAGRPIWEAYHHLFCHSCQTVPHNASSTGCSNRHSSETPDHKFFTGDGICLYKMAHQSPKRTFSINGKNSSIKDKIIRRNSCEESGGFCAMDALPVYGIESHNIP